MTETLQINTSSGKAELALLEDIKVGEVRRGAFLTGMYADLNWTCKKAHQKEWLFVGEFCGIEVIVVEIFLKGDTLSLKEWK